MHLVCMCGGRHFVEARPYTSEALALRNTEGVTLVQGLILVCPRCNNWASLNPDGSVQWHLPGERPL